MRDAGDYGGRCCGRCCVEMVDGSCGRDCSVARVDFWGCKG